MNYGLTPHSFILINDGKGDFTNMTGIQNDGVTAAGMITAAVWADVTGDSKKELIITGEWMAPRIFTFNGKYFEEVKTNLNDLFGMWQAVAACDINNDGRQDLILGNIGENFYLHPRKQDPVKLWMSDFDHNGVVDKIITRTVNKRDVPVFLKKDMTDQLASLKKQNLKYEDYARKSIQELFPEEVLNGSTQKVFDYSSSCIAINEGGGKFNVERLPDHVQFSSVNSIFCTDIDRDGSEDIILGGNKFEFQPQFSRLDASYGHVLLNNGKGQLKWIEPAISGLEIGGEIRDIVEIPGKNSDGILFLQNNDFPVLYRVNKNKTEKK